MADGGLTGSWLSEAIPDDDHLFLRVLRLQIDLDPDGELVVPAAALRNHGNGMSTNWDKYSDAEAVRHGSERHPPEDYAVASFRVGGVRAIPSQGVEHTPIFVGPGDPGNSRSHTDVVGPKSGSEFKALGKSGDEAAILTTEIRNRYISLAFWVIRPGE